MYNGEWASWKAVNQSLHNSNMVLSIQTNTTSSLTREVSSKKSMYKNESIFKIW